MAECSDPLDLVALRVRLVRAEQAAERARRVVLDAAERMDELAREVARLERLIAETTRGRSEETEAHD